nr:unnamed protein product [Callosobruchus chinensis]
MAVESTLSSFSRKQRTPYKYRAVDKQHHYSSDEIRDIVQTENADDETKKQLCELLHKYQVIFSECTGEI